jgi:hypothetical protein
MSQPVAQAFLANAKTTVVTDRPLTEAESASLTTVKQNAIDVGEQVSPNIAITDPGSGNVTNISYFSNIATANTYLAAYQAFVPPPLSAVVIAV